MTYQKKMIISEHRQSDAEYIEELESKLREKEQEARRASQRAEEYRRQILKQSAERRAALRKARRIVNGAITCAMVIITYWCVLAASAGDIPILSSAIPLTVGFAAAYRWGTFD